jgi:phosphopantetheine adenylyltransferase
VKTVHDGTVLNLNDSQVSIHRSDNTSMRDRHMALGYRKTTDHRFSIAQYGRLSRQERSKNIHKSQYNGRISQNFDNRPSEVKNRLFANMVKEVGKREVINTYRNEMDFSESVHIKNKIRQLAGDLSVVQKATQQSADVGELGYLNKNTTMVKVVDPINHSTVVVDKTIFDKVKENANVSFVKKTDSMLRRNIHTEEGRTIKPSDEMKVFVYKRKLPENTKQLETRMEQAWSDTDFTPIYKQGHGTITSLDATFTDAEQGVNPHSDAVFNGAKKGSGEHWNARSNIDKQVFNPTGVNDVTTNPRRMRSGRR